MHKKVKLAVLKLYKVDDSGKVERLRKECNAATCVPGVFMAHHFDRVGAQGQDAPSPTDSKRSARALRTFADLEIER